MRIEEALAISLSRGSASTSILARATKPHVIWPGSTWLNRDDHIIVELHRSHSDIPIASWRYDVGTYMFISSSLEILLTKYLSSSFDDWTPINLRRARDFPESIDPDIYVPRKPSRSDRSPDISGRSLESIIDRAIRDAYELGRLEAKGNPA